MKEIPRILLVAWLAICSQLHAAPASSGTHGAIVETTLATPLIPGSHGAVAATALAECMALVTIMYAWESEYGDASARGEAAFIGQGIAAAYKDITGKSVDDAADSGYARFINEIDSDKATIDDVIARYEPICDFVINHFM